MILERLQEMLTYRETENLPPAKQIVIGGFHAKNLANTMLEMLNEKHRVPVSHPNSVREVLSGTTVMGLPVIYVGNRDFIGVGE